MEGGRKQALGKLIIYLSVERASRIRQLFRALYSVRVLVTSTYKEAPGAKVDPLM